MLSGAGFELTPLANKQALYTLSNAVICDTNWYNSVNIQLGSFKILVNLKSKILKIYFIWN